MFRNFRKIFLILAVTVAGVWIITIAYFVLTEVLAEKEARVKSHLTLYVGEALLNNGGTVEVASVPIPVEEWRALDGNNLADLYPENAKRSLLNPEDRLFGAYVYGPASYVVMYYPEGGTFGFNLVPDPRIQNPKRLVTERILIGDGGWYDRATDTRHLWPHVSTIYIDGPSASKGNSRDIAFSVSDVLNLSPVKHEYAAVTVYSPSEQQLKQATHGRYE